MHITLAGGPACPGLMVSSSGVCTLARPPNFKQEKRRREEAQKRRNQEKQLQKAARRDGQRDPQKAEQEK